MAHFIRHLIAFVAVSLLLSGPSASAQPAVARTFTVLAGGAADWAELYYAAGPGSDYAPLAFNRQRRSPALAGPRNGSITFHRRQTNPDTGKPEYLPVAQGVWPADVTTALFVFMPRAASAPGEPQFDVFACDDGLETFPPETLRVVNTTRATFKARVGLETLDIPPGPSRIFSTTAFIPPNEEAPDPGMPLYLAVQGESGAFLLYDAPLSVGSRTRVLLLVLPPVKAGSSRIQVRAIHQTIPLPPAPGLSVTANRR